MNQLLRVINLTHVMSAYQIELFDAVETSGLSAQRSLRCGIESNPLLAAERHRTRTRSNECA